MEKDIKEILQKIVDNGFKAYIVGGYVRDFLLGINSNDIDITTNATPMDLKLIFNEIFIPKESYGSTTIFYKNIRYEITTFRSESSYLDNRHPSKIEYINDLKGDLLRRDFTINAICMDENLEVVDLLNGKEDLKNNIIKTIGDSIESFTNDALRILRAVRFATTHNFKLSDEIIKAIKVTKKYLKNISYDRKKRELDKIFGSFNAKMGIDLLIKLDLVEELDLSNLDRIKDYSDIVGVWAMINSGVYEHNKSMKELINKINIVYKLNNLDKMVLYKYGLYVNIIAGINKGINKKDIIKEFQDLKIHDKKDIQIKGNDICKILNVNGGKFINNLYNDLEYKIINGELINDYLELEKYIINNKDLILRNNN